MEYNPLAVAYTASAVAIILALVTSARAYRQRGMLTLSTASFMWVMAIGVTWLSIAAPNRAAWSPGDALTLQQEVALAEEREALGLPFALDMVFPRFQEEVLGTAPYASPQDPTITLAHYGQWVQWSSDLLETFSLELARSDPWCDSFADHLIALRLWQGDERLDFVEVGAVAYHERRIAILQSALLDGRFGGTVRTCLVRAQGSEATRLDDARRS